VLAISTGVVGEGEADEGIFVAEVGTVELRTPEGSLLGLFESGVPVAVGIFVTVTVELTVTVSKG